VLVVPYSRDAVTNAEISDSGVSDLKFFIEEAPGLVPVAGFEHEGIFVPDRLRFVRNVSSQELHNVKIDITGLPFFDKNTGELKDFSAAQNGDRFEYTLIRGLVDNTGVRDRIEFLPSAYYYDLSGFTIDTADLQPFGNYKFSWQCAYFNRVSTPENELFCIDKNDKRLARFSITVAHPGEIHQMMMEQTPSVYFDGKPLDKDNLVKFYRPFADALNDLFDEQSLLAGVNFIEKIPAQFIPYLAYLLGWDLPFFPGSTDRIRRAVLRNGRRLQQLKGSKRVIRELFELFGFTIDIVNLWYRRDGKQFVGPDEKQPGFEDEEIETQTICQTEVLVADYATDGFGGFEIPLLFRPSSDITIDAWLVETGSAADVQFASLLDIVDVDPEGLMGSVCPATSSGFLISQPLQDSITEPTLGKSQILVTQKFGAVDEVKSKDAPLSIHSVDYDFDRNIIELSFDHFIKFSNAKLYVFATYKRQKLIIPQKLTDLRSNRFDIRILFNRITGEAPNSQLLDFLLDFIFKLKAFHSILRKLVFTTQVVDVYNVTDFCLSGRISQEAGSDLGELQTLPPVIPTNQSGCTSEIFKRGFKESDFLLRDEVLTGLKAEHNAWKALDNTHAIPDSLKPIIDSLTRIRQNLPTEATYGTLDYGIAVYGELQPCEFTQHGQDRVIAKHTQIAGTIKRDFDHTIDDREKLCDDTNNILDNCFKGRVKQEIDSDRILLLRELIRCRPCGLMGGTGFYYTKPLVHKTLNSAEYNEVTYGRVEYGGHEIDTSDIKNLGISHLTDLLIRATADTDIINFTGTLGLTKNDIFTNDRIAIRRPSLDIDKDNMFFPGHRFVQMSSLVDDFSSNYYTFRPWDFNPRCVNPTDDFIYGEEEYGIFAYGATTITLDDLDAQLIEDSEGNEIITFNQIQYKIYGNGLTPDISSMGGHDDREFLVTHSIYSSTSDNGIINDSLTITPLTNVCFGEDYGSIFSSANGQCNCDNPTESFISGSTTTGGSDFIDGYPSEYNEFDLILDQFDYPRGESADVDLGYILDLPSDGSQVPSELLFKLGSGIKITNPDPSWRFYKPHRIDCGCSFFDCDGSTGAGVPHVVRCNIDLFRNEDGELDLHCDKIDITRMMVLNENVGACSSRLDGTSITNLFSFDPAKLQLVNDMPFPPSGEFFFVDSAFIVHEGSFEVNGSSIDITYTTRDPRVWNETQQGYVKNNKVFRRGVVTTCRQIVQTTSTSTNANVLAGGCVQKIDVFQTTFGCGDKLPNDPFAFHLECGILDDIEFEIICGPGWSSGDTMWCELIVDGSGDTVLDSSGQCLYWVDPWSNAETIITRCPTGTAD
jgi:phage tail P2-like protein